MFDGRFRKSVDKSLEPVGANIRQAGLRADHITLVGIVMSVAAAVAIGAGALHLGLLLLVLTGIPDLIDGAVAKAWGQASTRGAFFDSVSDRFTDAMLFGGLTWYLAAEHPDQPVYAVLPMAVFASASLPSYIRAKADALGLDGAGGFIERAERFIMLGVGLLFADLLLVPFLVVMFGLNLLTAGQRFARVWRQADAPRPERARREQRRARRQQRVPRTTASRRWQERSDRRDRRSWRETGSRRPPR